MAKIARGRAGSLWGLNAARAPSTRAGFIPWLLPSLPWLLLGGHCRQRSSLKMGSKNKGVLVGGGWREAKSGEGLLLGRSWEDFHCEEWGSLPGEGRGKGVTAELGEVPPCLERALLSPARSQPRSEQRQTPQQLTGCKFQSPHPGREMPGRRPVRLQLWKAREEPALLPPSPPFSLSPPQPAPSWRVIPQ